MRDDEIEKLGRTASSQCAGARHAELEWSSMIGSIVDAGVQARDG